MAKFILRTLIGFALTYGMWHWYNTNVLSKLDVEGQLVEFESEYGDYNADDYEDEYYEDDDHYAYDDYDTSSDW